MRAVVIYLVVGVLMAIVGDVRRRESTSMARFTSALLAVAAWPVFTPLVCLESLRSSEPASPSPLAQHIEQVLAEARAAVAGTRLEQLLPASLLASLHAGLREIDQRNCELEELLARPEFRAPDPRANAPHLASLGRLRQMHTRDQHTLEEIGKLSEALRAQLWVARYSGGESSRLESAHDANRAAKDLAAELASRVESLGAWFDLDSATDPANTRQHG